MKKNIRSLDQIIVECGKAESSAIPILQAIQQDYGFISKEHMKEICSKTEIKANRLYGIATFYSQFKLSPAGTNLIRICKGTACHVRGADNLIDVIKEELKIGIGETTADNKFTLETVACLGCCSLAPAVMINGEVYGKLTADKLKQILRGVQ
ncbi:MAG: NADH-quinone oxidoreductase subunit NuoE [Candidatus Margulisbacteria bacterium]|nr:NADH-quinone oxidoreductase subunit NuoE [Candidatus Margulisiibacteriota bacterium]